MKVQLLIAAMHKNPRKLVEKMQVSTDAILVNQCDENGYEEFDITDENGEKRVVKAYSFGEKGVGLSRNTALLRADKEISLFSDEDIIYEKDYESKIIKEFEKHKDADVLLFNVRVCEARRTYFHQKFHRVRWYNCGRYPAYAIAIRTERMHECNLTFSLLFGGGAKYSNGEDSLFLRDCLKAGLKMYASTEVIGEEEENESTWFFGYNRKFFYDRGVLYHYLYGKMAAVWGFRFLWKNKNTMCQKISLKQAYGYLKEGIYDAAHHKRNEER